MIFYMLCIFASFASLSCLVISPDVTTLSYIPSTHKTGIDIFFFLYLCRSFVFLFAHVMMISKFFYFVIHRPGFFLWPSMVFEVVSRRFS